MSDQFDGVISFCKNIPLDIGFFILFIIIRNITMTSFHYRTKYCQEIEIIVKTNNIIEKNDHINRLKKEILNRVFYKSL